jgi:hypothetical protein
MDNAKLWNEIADDTVDNYLPVLVELAEQTIERFAEEGLTGEELLNILTSCTIAGRFIERQRLVDDEKVAYLLRNFKMPNFGQGE